MGDNKGWRYENLCEICRESRGSKKFFGQKVCFTCNREMKEGMPKFNTWDCYNG